MRIKLTAETLGLMRIFQNTTRARLKDCFVDKNSTLTFVVEQNELGRALGKKAVNLKALESKLNKKIKILEYNPNLEQFIKNIIYPSKVKSIVVADDVVTLEPLDSPTRGYLIGRAASNLRNHESTVKRYFKDVKELKVI